MDKSQFYAELLEYGRQRGFKKGWSAYAYRARFGCFPERDVASRAEYLNVAVSYETLEWLEEYFAAERQKRQGGTAESASPSQGPAIPKERVRQLRSLVHPDRWHGTPQEQTAVEVSQWLNTLD